ncbi:MAG: flagellar basal body-associated FliL family protein [Ideonella sp. WA131b]|jgi:flagellar FliL protein|nr:flagellar basal body-associated FliL family protein [Ideonella sp. WA131b]
MSAAATAVDAAPPPKGKKKLIIIIAAVLLVVLAGGGAALVMMKKSGADTEEGAGANEAPADKKAADKRDPKAMPVFVPLDPFTVNLADRNADRYAQVAVTLELAEATLEQQLKAYMPAVRSNILLAIADRTAGELLARDGKEALAQRIRRETARAMGYELPSEEQRQAAEEPADGDVPRKKRRKAAEPELPVRAVHFGNFIIQ